MQQQAELNRNPIEILLNKLRNTTSKVANFNGRNLNNSDLQSRRNEIEEAFINNSAVTTIIFDTINFEAAQFMAEMIKNSPKLEGLHLKKLSAQTCYALLNNLPANIQLITVQELEDDAIQQIFKCIKDNVNLTRVNVMQSPEKMLTKTLTELKQCRYVTSLRIFKFDSLPISQMLNLINSNDYIEKVTIDQDINRNCSAAVSALKQSLHKSIELDLQIPGNYEVLRPATEKKENRTKAHDQTSTFSNSIIENLKPISRSKSDEIKLNLSPESSPIKYSSNEFTSASSSEGNLPQKFQNDSFKLYNSRQFSGKRPNEYPRNTPKCRTPYSDFKHKDDRNNTDKSKAITSPVKYNSHNGSNYKRDDRSPNRDDRSPHVERYTNHSNYSPERPRDVYAKKNPHSISPRRSNREESNEEQSPRSENRKRTFEKISLSENEYDKTNLHRRNNLPEERKEIQNKTEETPKKDDSILIQNNSDTLSPQKNFVEKVQEPETQNQTTQYPQNDSTINSKTDQHPNAEKMDIVSNDNSQAAEINVSPSSKQNNPEVLTLAVEHVKVIAQNKLLEAELSNYKTIVNQLLSVLETVSEKFPAKLEAMTNQTYNILPTNSENFTNNNSNGNYQSPSVKTNNKLPSYLQFFIKKPEQSNVSAQSGTTSVSLFSEKEKNLLTTIIKKT